MEPTGDREENGNSDSSSSLPTKRVTQLYKYDFVINNFIESELETLNTTLKKFTKKSVYGKEVGDSGTPHLQGYMSLIRKARYTELHLLPGLAKASFRPVRNDEACILYCQKDNCCFKYGFPIELKTICKLKIWQNEIKESCLTSPDERTINWLYDNKTNIGKTAFIKFMVHKHNAVFFTSGRKSDIACQLALEKQNGRDLNNNMIILFNYSYEDTDIDYKAFEALKDGLMSSSKYKSSGLIFNHPHIWIMANTLPDKEVISRRANVWKIWNVLGDKLCLSI